MKLRLSALGAGLTLAVTLLAQDVKYNFDKDADFSKYRTYRWEQHPDSRQLDQLTLTQLGAAFDAELAKKGLQKSTTGTSDLVFVYQLATSQEKQINTFDSGYGTGPGYRGGWYGGGSSMSTSTTTTINIGSVALDMYDASKKQLVWRGTASKTIDSNAKPDKRQKNMAKAAEKMLKNYPPKAKS